MNGLIYIGIASYRDKDLFKTVANAYHNAINKERLYFSIYSQESEEEHVDLSFIPSYQLNHVCVPYQTARGACYARHMTNMGVSDAFDYFIQVDSHSRFDYGWDVTLIDAYERAKKERWGERLIISASASSFEFEWNEDGTYEDTNFETYIGINIPKWDEDERMFLTDIIEYTGDDIGQETFYICANFFFTSGKIMSELVYDPYLYFWGEEITLAVRAYTKGIKIMSPPFSVVYSNLNRENCKRPLVWDDRPEKWTILDAASKTRAAHILKGERGFGIYGVDSLVLFEEYQAKTGVDLVNQNYSL